MERRTAALAFLAGTLPIFTPMMGRSAHAQAPANMIPRDLGRYRSTTLMVGSLALKSSQLALQRATRPQVKEFAEFETAEQLTMAQVLTDTPSPSAARLDSTRAAQLQALSSFQPGQNFDVQYVTLQLQTHQELLEVQNSFLQAQPSMSSDVAHIAMLARATIQMHLTLLERLRQLA